MKIHLRILLEAMAVGQFPINSTAAPHDFDLLSPMQH